MLNKAASLNFSGSPASQEASGSRGSRFFAEPLQKVVSRLKEGQAWEPSHRGHRRRQLLRQYFKCQRASRSCLARKCRRALLAMSLRALVALSALLRPTSRAQSRRTSTSLLLCPRLGRGGRGPVPATSQLPEFGFHLSPILRGNPSRARVCAPVPREFPRPRRERSAEPIRPPRHSCRIQLS